MISKQTFSHIDKEVRDAIQNTLDNLKKNNSSNYVLFLAQGEFLEKDDKNLLNFDLYVIDYRIDEYKDKTRLTFLTNFLNTFYSFTVNKQATDDNEQRIHMELMIYCHIWESKPFLKKLYRLAHITNGKDYDWKVSIPDMTKWKFIRHEIKRAFDSSGSKLSEIIKKGFHSSLRNAFAHSEFSLDTIGGNKRIWLDTYKGDKWDIQEISFDEWSKKFAYSFLLSYYLLILTQKSRRNLIKDFKTNKFNIKYPDSQTGKINDVNIIYEEDRDRFSR